MRTLFDLPDISERTIISKRAAGIPDLSTLKGNQVGIVRDILATLSEEGGCIISLEGYAGTGKTYVISRIIEQYLNDNPFSRIAFSATTNQAVKVSYRSTEYQHHNLEYATIHKLLGLKEMIQKDGTIEFYPDKFIPATIGTYKVAFIDETSMLGKRLFGYLLPHIEEGLKVVFVGDPLQIPPVKETESVVYMPREQKIHSMRVFKLTEIVRQAADNPIIGVTTSVRENIDRAMSFGQVFQHKDRLWDGDKGVYFMNTDLSDDKAYFDSLLQHIFTSANFKADANFGKVIAWRNKTVNAINRGIRKMIYGKGKLRRIEPGEKLRTKQPVWDKDTDRIIINNAEELEVLEMDRHVEKINDGQYELPYYHTKVRYYDMYGNAVVKMINIPTDLGAITLDEILTLLAKAAKGYKPGSLPASQAWREFYAFKKEYAEVTYNYAITSHLAQGSTFANAIVCEFDIDAIPDIRGRNRLKYTAFSRPSERLFII